jgi:hypothetical protein
LVFFEGDSKQEARWKMIESVERKTLAGSCSSRSVNRALEATLRCGADLFRLLFPGAGALAVIWVAKQARLFEKHGLDVAPVLIPSSVRTLQRSLPAKAPSLKAQVRPRLARALPAAILLLWPAA